jgi:hypothetical protein
MAASTDAVVRTFRAALLTGQGVDQGVGLDRLEATPIARFSPATTQAAEQARKVE